MIVTPQDITWILSEYTYISDNAIDAGLLLLDKRLNDPSQHSKDRITVYSIQELRLILSGEKALVKPGKFICIMPRNFALNDVEEQKRANAADPGGHFTMISNLQCAPDEVNCYETFPPYRNQDNLLTAAAAKLIRILSGLAESDLRQVEVNCVNVATQRESECGALAFAIALQLCFHYPMGGIHSTIQNVRKQLLFCLQRNELQDFMTTPNAVTDEMLFSINI